MTGPNELPGQDDPVEIAHEFVVDLNCVVLANHRFALEGIARAEDEELNGWQEALALEDSEVRSSVIQREQEGFDELRRAANRLALVGLVTRLQHWIGRFVRQENLKPHRTCASMLVRQLEILNDALGEGPVATLNFGELVDVRDSIVHADARSEWKDDRNGDSREVALRYRGDCGEVELSEEQLRDEVDKATRQVSWYNRKLRRPVVS